MEDKKMDIIDLARQLGATIQKEEAYVAYQAAKAANDADETLQGLIGEFNLLRMSLTNELQKPEDQKSQSKIEELNKQLQKLYEDVMNNDSMKNSNAAKKKMDEVSNKITSILAMCIKGQDPATCEPAGCSGSCSTCGGCC